MNTCESRVACLKNTELFKSLSDDELQALANQLKERVYPPNTAIVREGAQGDSMFIIKDGKVDVKKKEPSLGIDLTIATLENGACFGEMALLTGNPRSATVMAVVPTSVFVLDKKDFERLLMEHRSISLSLNKIVAERIESLNAQKGMGMVSLAKLKLDADVLSFIPEQLIKKYRILPIAYSNSTLSLAMVNPNDLLAIDEVRKFIKGLAIEPVVISEDDFKTFMEKEYPEIMKKGEDKQEVNLDSLLESMDNVQSDFLKDVEIEESKEDDIGITDLQNEAQEAPIIRLTNNIIAMALKKGASDIHIEPMEKSLRVRYRIDGVLREEMVLPRKVVLPLVSRIKIISKLDITERRLPQDGRITMRLGSKSIDFRVSTIPTKFGEKICTRILDKSNTAMGLDKLITHKPTLDLVREMIAKPYGIIYVTGPTGSGKSTTLYSALAEKNSIDVNISTVEDPIEYDLAGINQVQVNADIGLDFARVLRAFLRQDPDIILVGETRDKETAKIAVEAALTGHLVFTTLHANDAPSTFMRLNEMGIEPFLTSTSIIGIIAQRLVRRICPQCKEKYKPEGVVLKYLGLEEGVELYKGKGCDACGLSGYKGRVGVYEVLMVNESVRHLIAEGADTQVIRQEAINSGMRTLKDYCLILLQEGLTTVDEVLRTVAIQT
ncbi:MAG TPA: ATPase, T2SS/T4P/T4SS family [Syntrophorhabdaceae bacterium]|nr:ATPase, T2SS/T4P/T4SS family [Syntrophorhabdaceae bacterium]HOL05956.1 ATPase, T2SS/T4P/T4SS family [Syntrophorhabdaceae bacterium]HON84949.1 ATPase, T2SS/T4P/T4SS family [Syntrophorhabdaceae bacterium]HOT41713.1 ATPase, T2SS/T4P/T4SS family [Syntrophorhabdaceae bacterium]HPC66596.1 ATPase, T2SS/T4P/T4SS family [Syntrophorhabdaceae bacterium]